MKHEYDDDQYDSRMCAAALSEHHTEREICFACNGSGEGHYDGATCSMCNGQGEV